MLISNFSIMSLLAKWYIAIRAAHSDTERPRLVGIGCLSNSELLPLVMIPRLRNALTSFFSAGLILEGDQLPLTQAWFKIYPNNTEVALFFFSVLNVFAKLSRRRMMDAFFGPSLMFFCVLHWNRYTLARKGWYGCQGCVASTLSASEAKRIHLWIFFSTKVTLRLGGNITRLYGLTLIVLGLNLLPLLFADYLCVGANRERSAPSTRIQHVLSIRPCATAGLGRSSSDQNALLPIYDFVFEYNAPVPQLPRTCDGV